MTSQSDVIFFRNSEISIIYMIKNYGKLNIKCIISLEQWNIMMTRFATICYHMTYVTCRVKAWLHRQKMDIWLLLYVAVSELEQWFCLCFARYLGKKIHSNYLRLRNLHCLTLKLKVMSRSTWFLLFLLVFVLLRWFFCFVRFLGHKNHSKYRRLRGLYAWPSNWRSRTRDLETEDHVKIYVTDVISACVYPTAMNVLLFRDVFWSRNSL